MIKQKNRTTALTQKEVEEFFNEHLPYRMTLLTTHNLINNENPELKKGIPEIVLDKINICSIEASLISSRMFIEFLGLGIRYNPLRLVQQRDYFQADDANAYEVKIIDLGGKWVEIDSLNDDERNLLARMYLTGHRATAHLTYNAPYGSEWKIIHSANELIYKLLKINLYDFVGEKIKIK